MLWDEVRAEYRVAKTRRILYRSLFAKEPLITGLFCRKWPVNIKVYRVSDIWGLTERRRFSCRSLFAKEPLIVGLFCGKRPMKIRHPAHRVENLTSYVYVRLFLPYRSLFAKEPLLTGLCCGKWNIKIKIRLYRVSNIWGLMFMWGKRALYTSAKKPYIQKNSLTYT